MPDLVDVSIEGADDLQRLAARLKEAGRNDLRKELLAGIRKANKPIVAAIRDGIRERLPSRGGLADEVARATISTRTKLTGRSVGVTMLGTKGKSKLERLNRGILRHPLFGHGPWFVQQVEPGWFDDSIREKLDVLRNNITDAMDAVADKLTKGL